MIFFDRLQAATETERQYLLETPLINDSIRGQSSLSVYAAYLCQAYHHVKHTVPLLMATGARLPESHEWLRDAVAEYIDEEHGHQEWILNDIAACGYDREAARNTRPTLATELLVSYAYDTIQRINPIGFFGMVHVLEGTSIVAADSAAAGIQRALGLPDQAFSYLRSHGALDQDHVKFFAKLMNRIDDAEEQEIIIHCAKVFYRLFSDVLRSVSADQVATLPHVTGKEPAMQLDGERIVLTGAAGGMGELIATELVAHGARLVLSDLNESRLAQVAERLGSEHTIVAADLTSDAGRSRLLTVCRELQDIDMLINAAGMSEYALLETQSASRIELMMTINLVVPMLLCQGFLPFLKSRPEAAIVNIGSTFGSIGHPGFATYCASKFGLRGFTETLRRELSDTNIQVFYIAPRATQTDMNSPAVVQLNQELGNTMDKPQVVVESLMRMLGSKSGGDYFLGWPEKLFVRLNGLLPKVVDAALGKQLATIKRLAG